MIRLKDLLPLVGFLVPTIVIGYGLVIPRSCIAGVNPLSVGFGATLLGATVTYLLGVRAARRDGARRGRSAVGASDTVREGNN
jgi:ABC-type Fe3+ transport system permease subunit